MFSVNVQKKIEKQFFDFAKRFPMFGEDVYAMKERCDNETFLILKYLYANMPISDAANYEPEIFLKFAEHAVFIRKHPVVQYQEEITDEMFLEYVAYHRVNTEDITDSRKLFYDNLKKRISRNSACQAIIDVNYWCAEEAAYQSTDDRTISAEGVFKSGIGRCGEESVFVVNALRSVGILARQVYAHRWAHCDDNHAWVEAWCNGDWHFLGACEPEEILNRGWFCNASSRAMMINSRIYGTQKPDGRIIERNGMTSATAQINRYAETVKIQINVVDSDGNTVNNAKVTCELLNYAELVPVVTGYTDDKGIFSFETGKGSLFITGVKGREEGSKVIHVSESKNFSVEIAEDNPFYQKDGGWLEFNMYAPPEAPVNTSELSPEQKKDSEQNLSVAAEKRTKKVSDFPKETDGKLLFYSRGNSEEIKRFLDKENDERSVREQILSILPEKDFRDCRADILEEHVKEAARWKNQTKEELFVRYILNPRISVEQQSSYRTYIREYFKERQAEEFRRDPEKIWRWISENIRSEEDWEYDELLTVPKGCLKYGIASKKSQKVLFVAICRTFGIPARLSPEEGQAEYYRESGFGEIGGIEKQEKDSGLHIQFEAGVNWKYMQNWSISKKADGTAIWKTLNITCGSGTVYLESGTYRIITTNRLPNGNQYAAVKKIRIKKGEIANVKISLRYVSPEDMLTDIPVSNFKLLDRQFRIVDGKEKTAGKKNTLFIWLEVGKEPTEHILNEIRERRDEYALLSERINFILTKKEDLDDPVLKKTIRLLSGASVYFDNSTENVNIIARRMYGDPDKLPLILILTPEMKGIYSASGYNVGTGDMILRIME